VPASVAGPKSEAASLRALEIQPDLAEPFLWLGVIRAWSGFNWPLAEEMFNKSIELNPNFADARGSYSHLLAVLGRFDESLAQIEVGLQLDPFNGWILGLYGVIYHMDHRYDEAIAKFEEALRVSPDLPFVLMGLTGSYQYSGRFEEAVQTEALYLDAVGMSDKRGEFLDRYEQHGYEPAMRFMADLMAEQSLAIGTLGAMTAVRYARAGDTKKAIEWLERGYEQRDPNIPYLRLPEFDQLRSDPRFQALMQRLDLL
jgi:tetratricopeptide (TPR) repeat protein